MSVMKFDKTPTPLEEVIKINEIIDNLGLGGAGIVKREISASEWVQQSDGSYVYTVPENLKVIAVYKEEGSSYKLIECDVYGNLTNSYVKTKSAFDGFAYVTNDQDEIENPRVITNCITQIPQDVKVELNDNKTITIKAGTKCYIPNGFESDGTTRKFEEYIYLNDHICQCPTSTGDFFLLPVIGTNFERHSYKNATFSGPTQPTMTIQVGIWYDTANNVIKMTNDTGATWIDDRQIALPIATEHCITANVESSITQVFNGFGYIGSTIYKLPGIVGLIPSGRNDDGTLKNTKVTTDTVSIRTISTLNEANHTNFAICKEVVGGLDISINDFTLDEVNNYLYNSGNEAQPDRFVAGKIEIEKTSPFKIISLTPKTTFHAVDYNDISSLSRSIGIPDVSSRITIASGYVAVSDGWITYLGSSNDTSQYLNIDGVRIVQNYGSRGDWVDSTSAQMPVKKGATIAFVGTCYFYPYIEE